MERGKDISLAFKILCIIGLAAIIYLITVIFNFPLHFYIGLIVGIGVALLIVLIFKKMPKIYVKASKY